MWFGVAAAAETLNLKAQQLLELSDDVSPATTASLPSPRNPVGQQPTATDTDATPATAAVAEEVPEQQQQCQGQPEPSEIPPSTQQAAPADNAVAQPCQVAAARAAVVNQSKACAAAASSLSKPARPKRDAAAGKKKAAADQTNDGAALPDGPRLGAAAHDKPMGAGCSAQPATQQQAGSQPVSAAQAGSVPGSAAQDAAAKLLRHGAVHAANIPGLGYTEVVRNRAVTPVNSSPQLDEVMAAKNTTLHSLQGGPVGDNKP